MKQFVALALAVLAAASQAAFAQTSLERFERQIEDIQLDTRVRTDLNLPVDRRVLMDYGAAISLDYLSVQDLKQNTHVLRQYDLVGYGRLSLDGVHEFFARGRIFYRDFAPGDNFDPSRGPWFGRVEQAYYRFDLAKSLAAYGGRVIDGDLSVQVGRQYVLWGNGLTLSDTIDGGVVDVTLGPLTGEIVAGVTPTYTVDIDPSRPDFNHHTLRGFYGLTVGARRGDFRPYGYALIQTDDNPDKAVTINSALTRFGYDSFYIGGGVAGSYGDHLVYGVEGVYEGGRGLSNSFRPATGGSITPINQTREDVAAGAMNARMDYAFNDVRRSRFSAELTLATGDTNRLSSTQTFGGNRPGTDDHAFNGFGLLDTGLAFAPAVSNIMVGRVGFATLPAPNLDLLRRLQVGADFLVFRKFNEHAPIDEPTDGGSFLGVEPDFHANWQLTSDVTLAARYGIFFPGGAIHNGGTRQFLYIGLTWSF